MNLQFESILSLQLSSCVVLENLKKYRNIFFSLFIRDIRSISSYSKFNLNFATIINFFIVISIGSSFNLLNIGGIHSWPRHDVSTLRMLQIVHTHGDRTPSTFVHNDPYADLTMFWREGVGQLTKKGLYVCLIL